MGFARNAERAAPWYFPGVRALATHQQLEFQMDEVKRTWDRFAALACLSEAARTELARRRRK